MILRIKVISKKNRKKGRIIVWIQNHRDLREEIQQLITFFKDEIQVRKRFFFHLYYKFSSEKPVTMLSLLTTIQELIPEVFFNSSTSPDLEDFPNL